MAANGAMTFNEEKVLLWLENQGYDVLRGGWPDFLCVMDGKAVAIEVKSGIHQLSERQMKMREALRLAGVQVRTIRVDGGIVRGIELGGGLIPVHSASRIIGDSRVLWQLVNSGILKRRMKAGREETYFARNEVQALRGIGRPSESERLMALLEAQPPSAPPAALSSGPVASPGPP